MNKTSIIALIMLCTQLTFSPIIASHNDFDNIANLDLSCFDFNNDTISTQKNMIASKAAPAIPPASLHTRHQARLLAYQCMPLTADDELDTLLLYDSTLNHGPFNSNCNKKAYLYPATLSTSCSNNSIKSDARSLTRSSSASKRKSIDNHTHDQDCEQHNLQDIKKPKIAKITKKIVQQKKYYDENKKVILAYQAEYRANNKNLIQARDAKYYAKNKKSIRAKHTEYRANNQESIRAYHAEYNANHKAYQAEYYAKNKVHKAKCRAKKKKQALW